MVNINNKISPAELLKNIQDTLQRLKIDYEKIIEEFGQVTASEKREKGVKFSINDHLKALILAMLSNQRPWGPIAKNLKIINEIFFNYDLEKIKNSDKREFEDKLRQIKCGNRSISKQMKSLDYNIPVLLLIQNQYDSLDNFVTSDAPEKIATELSKGKKYKLKQIGFPLALEYLRNVGIRAVKPDVHMRRIISNERLNYCSCYPTEEETVKVLSSLAKQIGVNPTYLDNLVWIFCAVDYGNICNENPKCHFCSLRSLCNFPTAAKNNEIMGRLF